MSEQRLFAGFWRDGAVVQPSRDHFTNEWIVVRHKAKVSLDVYSRSFTSFDEVYWLDTIPPTELTPQEAFQLLKVMFPKAKRIIRDSAFAITFDCDGETSIVWGETTEYPPKQRWRVPTDADKRSKCRVWDTEKSEWVDGTFIATWNDSFIVKGKDWPYPIEVTKCEVLE
jgi:hypothetical protein